MAKKYSKINFHKHTFCIWQEVTSDVVADLKISYISDSGSQYIFTEEGVFRISNHWGRVANCHWRLVPLKDFKSQNTIVAFANWIDFYANDDTSKLFFIRINWETREVNFYHKLTAMTDENAVLRNAKDTAKIIRTIKEVLIESDWAKYLNYEDLENLRQEVIAELVTTTKTFVAIKKKYLH